jgi:hypothetical protein
LILLSLVIHRQARFFLESYYSFDKGKPVEKRGRKAKDLKLYASIATTAWPPKAKPNIRWIDLSAFIA